MRLQHLILCFFLISSCSDNKRHFVPDRPTNIPIDAVYFGGVDGGDWLLCKPTGTSTLDCEVYHPIDGIHLRTIHLRLCLNLSLNLSDHQFSYGRGILMDDGLFANGVHFYFDKADTIEDGDPISVEMANKYYDRYGVTPSCELASKVTSSK